MFAVAPAFTNILVRSCRSGRASVQGAMLQFTTIARASDGLVLGADTESSQQGPELERVKATAKNLLKKLSGQGHNLAEALTVEASSNNFHILNEGGVLFLTMCDPSSPSQTAFAYLESIAKDFLHQHGQQVDAAKRPYYFIKFDMTLQRTKKQFSSYQYGNAPAPRNTAPEKKSFRDIMGYGPAPKSQASGTVAGNDMAIAVIAAVVALVVIIAVVGGIIWLS
jgi:vesicle transport protein SEC22